MRSLTLSALLWWAAFAAGNNGNNESSEIYRASSYKVHPDPQDFEYGDPRVMIINSVSGSEGNHSGSLNQQQQSRGTEENGPLYDYYGNSYYTPESLAHKKHGSAYRESPFYGQQPAYGGHKNSEAPSVFNAGFNKDSTPYRPMSGYSSDYKYTNPNGEALRWSKPNGSAVSVNRPVPKSTVFFNMNHGPENEQKSATEYRSEVVHQEVSSGSQEHSLNQSKTIGNYMPLENAQAYGKPGGGYLSADVKGRVPYNYMTKVRAHNDDKTVGEFKSDAKLVNYHFLNYPKTRNTGQTMTIAQYANEFKTEFPYGNLNAAVDAKQRNQEQQGQQQQQQHVRIEPPYAVMMQATANGHPSAANHQAVEGLPRRGRFRGKNFKFLKYDGNAKGMKYKQKGHLDATTFSKSSSPAVHGPNNPTVSYSVTEEDNSGRESGSAYRKQNALSSSVSNVVFPAGSFPWKVDHRTKNLVTFRNPWKFTPIKSIDFQHSFSHLPLVYKPADSFHFEVNPFIDIDEYSQGIFDHRKASEESSDFGIGYAIGSKNEESAEEEEEEEDIRIGRAPEQSIDLAQGTAAHPTKLYSSVSPTPFLLSSGGDHHEDEDSLTSTSQFLQQTAIAGPEFSRGSLLRFQPEDVLLPLKQQQQQTVSKESVTYRNLVKLHHQPKDRDPMRNARFSNDLFPSQSKSKKFLNSLKGYKLIPETYHRFPETSRPSVIQTRYGRPASSLIPLGEDVWTIRKPKLLIGKPGKIKLKTASIPYVIEKQS